MGLINSMYKNKKLNINSKCVRSAKVVPHQLLWPPLCAQVQPSALGGDISSHALVRPCLQGQVGFWAPLCERGLEKWTVSGSEGSKWWRHTTARRLKALGRFRKRGGTRVRWWLGSNSGRIVVRNRTIFAQGDLKGQSQGTWNKC